MTRTKLIRGLLAVAMAAAMFVDTAQAQCLTNDCGPRFPPIRPNGPGSSGNSDSSSGRNIGWYVVGGAVVAIIGLAIGNQVFANQGTTDQPPPNAPPPPPPSFPQFSAIETSP